MSGCQLIQVMSVYIRFVRLIQVNTYKVGLGQVMSG